MSILFFILSSDIISPGFVSTPACRNPLRFRTLHGRLLMKTLRFSGRRPLFGLVILLILFLFPAALAEPSVSFSPAAPRAGDPVDVVVTPNREGAQSVTYQLSTPEGVVFAGEADTHFSASFRPREEAEYTLQVTVSYGKKDEETASVTVPVSGFAPVQAGEDVVYSQKDGWWKSKVYSAKHKRSLEKAGCAIFALSHALQRLGNTGEEVLPDALAETYTKCYIEERGTDNERLLTLAGEAWDFLTQSELIESEADLALCLKRGDLFSFSIVIGHIALAEGLSEDGTKVRIVDSAPGATWERIKKASLYVQAEDGSFKAVQDPMQIPGLRYYFETREYGGTKYWLDLSYCAKRGMRLIRRPWLKLETEGGPQTVTLEQFGTVESRVTPRGGEALTAATADLRWTASGAEDTPVALVSKKGGTAFLDGNGKKISGFKTIPEGTVLPVLEAEDKTLYVAWKGAFGHITRKDAELIALPEETLSSALISVNGHTNGRATVKIRASASAKGRGIAEWKTGTRVYVLQESKGFYLVEGKGARGWVQGTYLTMEGQDENGQKVDEGK